VKDVARLLNELHDAGIISDYAVFGATAQMRYTEPVATLDADVLVAGSRGYKAQGETIVVGGWPVQFVPVFSALTADAVRHAESDEIEGVALRVVTAGYLAVIALSVGRSKDHLRIISLLESGAVAREEIEALASRHELSDRWTRFRQRYLDA
jgi:hypothetical protein